MFDSKANCPEQLDGKKVAPPLTILGHPPPTTGPGCHYIFRNQILSSSHKDTLHTCKPHDMEYCAFPVS